MEKQTAYSEHYLLREIRTVKGVLRHPKSLHFQRNCQLLMVQCDTHLYFISLLNVVRGAKQLVAHFAPSDVYLLLAFIV